MSYLVLARKYRPQTFAQVVGQLPVVKTLQNSLLRNRVAHAILFSGVRGVGKTTLARIMAKAINCEGNTDTPPCNTCKSCTEITGGQSLDLHEIDGASNRGIQEIRELKEKIRFMPTSSQYKIIIIDEVHMLTTEAFNALLKTLEEPPDHVYFMFATTEIHKIPITILSRCQRYELKRISAAELQAHFQKIADEEQVTIEQTALNMIVREAEGSVRDGLSLLDQMFAYADSSISIADVIQVLGLTDRSILLSISHSLLKGDRVSALKTLESTFEYGIDLKRFTSDLLQCFRTLLLVKIGSCEELIELPEEEIIHLETIAREYSFETIHLKLELLLRAVEEMRYTSQPRLALETAFLKIIESANVISIDTLLAKIDQLSDNLEDHDTIQATKKKVEENDDINSEKEQPPLPPEPPPEFIESAPQPTPKATKLSPSPVQQEPQVKEDHPNKSDDSRKEQDSKGSEDRVNTVTIRPHTHDIRRDWDDFISYVKERKVWMAQDLQRTETIKEVENELHLYYSDPTTCTLLRSKENHKLLTEFVLDFFQKDLTVRFILPDPENNGYGDDDQESPHKQRQQLAHDPLVQMAVEIFNGQVGDIRVGPRSR